MPNPQPPPVSAPYVGVKYVVKVGNTFLTSIEFADGHVMADGFPDFSLSLESFEKLFSSTTRGFLRMVSFGNHGIKPSNFSSSPTKFDYSVTGGNWKMKVHIGSLKADYVYNFSSKLVEVSRPGQYNIGYGEYILWVSAIDTFISTAKTLRTE